MSTSDWQEKPVVFDCEGCRLVGIVSHPANPVATGVVIVVGGPQYRAGSHRQFTLLARELASRGIASIRFDYRGMGDSEGEKRSFEDIGPDIRAAIGTLLEHATAVQRVVLWGLCDAASAAAIYAHADPRVAMLVMVNPWVEGIEARARLKSYYPQRIGQTSFWTRLLLLDINVMSALKSLAGDMKDAFRILAGKGSHMNPPANMRMLAGLESFQRDTVSIIGERDLTGQSFCALVKSDARWRQACRATQFMVIAGADHTFSTRLWRNQVAEATAAAVQQANAKIRTEVAATADDMAGLHCELTAVSSKSVDELAPMWTRLEATSNASVFQSWLWIGTWIAALPDSVELHLLKVSHLGEVVGLGVFGKATQVRHGVIRSRMLSLSETGQPTFDGLTVEHNDLLVRRGWEGKVWQAALDKFAKWDEEWDEIHVSGMSNAAALDTIKQLALARDLLAQVELSKPYFWVDLQALRNDSQDYLNALSSNTRQQIKKSLRLYGERGPVTVTVADSPKLAFAYFEDLKELHQHYWTQKGQPGAFASEFANRFHRELIARGLPTRQVQLAKVTAGETTIGVLYNLIHGDQVYNYQAGLVYDDNPRLKPGLTCHVLAIEMNIASGRKTYDFLMGDSQYKRSLSTSQDEMHWLSIKQPTMRFALEEFARRTKRQLRTLRDTPTT